MYLRVVRERRIRVYYEQTAARVRCVITGAADRIVNDLVVIALIGAGSRSFGPETVRDVLDGSKSFPVGMFAVLRNPARQRFGDRWAGTYVVRA